MLGLIKRVALRAMRVVAPLAVIGVAGAAAAADLQVSGYSWDPDPAANGGQAKFTITVANNGPGPVSDAVVNIAVPSNFSVQTGEFPTYCILSGVVGSQSLACSLPTLPVGTFEFDYMADAKEIGSRTASASISSPTNVDNNPANNTLSVSPAVEAGADLVVTKNDNLPTDSIPAGGIINYTLKAVNQGPDATGAIRLVDNLPAASNFEFLTAAGTNWNCSRSGTAVTCNYTGPAVTGALPDVTVSGRVLATGGTITNNAFVAITGSGVQDPKPDNNTATPVVTTIEPGADFEAEKSMPSTIIQGETVNITLGVRNRGPWTVAGASIVDVIAPEFQIGTLPAGCTAVGNTVTCIAGNLATGENQDFIIPVTAMSPTAGTVVNSAIVNLPAGVTDPVPGNNTKDVSYEIAAPSSDLSLTKSKGPNPVAAGGIMTSTITVVNNGPSILTYDPANPLRIVDTVTANETFSSADAPWTCSQAGLQITCELTGPGALAVGSNIALSLKTTAGTGVDMDLSNTACTGTLGGSGALPADGNDLNDCAGAGTRSTPDAADLVILKEVSLDKVTWTQTPAITVADNVTSFYIRLTVSNAGGNIARTVNVVDMLPNFLNSGSMITAVVQDSISTGSMSYTSSNGRLAWNLTNLTVGAPQTLIVRVDRPFESGTFNNRATVSSPDTTETNTANNESTASYTIEAITDITLNAKSIAPNPARVGGYLDL